MPEETRNERETPEDAASGAHGDLGRPIGGSRPIVGTRRADLPILASGEQAMIGAVDLRAARDA